MALYMVVFIISLIRLPLYKDTPLKFLPLIFFITVVAEYAGYIFKVLDHGVNLIVYNIYYLLHFTFFSYVFMKMIDNVRFKGYIKVGMGVFWLFYLGDLIFTGITQGSFAASYIAGAGVLVFCIILYYISILESSLVLVVKNDLLFWVSVGLFLFYIGYLPIKIVRSWFYNFNKFFELLQVIQFSLIIVMYLFFLAGFLWMKRR